MREIKFRAWDKVGKQMHQIMETVSNSQTGILMITSHDGTVLKIPEEAELMQYTGLKDKNGKEIYEGYIVAYPSGHFIGEVIYSTMTGCAFRLWEGGMSSEKGEIKELQSTSDIEIIGNIYENPELLN